MKEKKEVLVFLKLHEDSLVDELKEEFKIQIDTRHYYKGFKRIRFDEWLDRKMRLSLLDKAIKVDAELRLLLIEEEQVINVMDAIIRRSF